MSEISLLRYAASSTPERKKSQHAAVAFQNDAPRVLGRARRDVQKPTTVCFGPQSEVPVNLGTVAIDAVVMERNHERCRFLTRVRGRNIQACRTIPAERGSATGQLGRGDLWDGPGYDTATAIAAHTTMLAKQLQQYEPVGWAEELLPAAIATDVAQLPRLYIAASTCMFVGRPDDAVGYAQASLALQDNPGYRPFDPAWAPYREAFAHFYAGRPDPCVEISAALAARTGLARVMGLYGQAIGLTVVGRSGEAMATAEDALNTALAHANPFWIASAYYGCGRAISVTDPARALDTFRVGLAYTRQHRIPRVEALIARNAAGLEAVHGDLNQALTLFTTAINSFHQAGNRGDLALAFTVLVVFCDRINRPEIAATLYGTTTRHPFFNLNTASLAAIDHVRNTLDTETFNRCAANGAAMETAEAVRYARTRIEAV